MFCPARTKSLGNIDNSLALSTAPAGLADECTFDLFCSVDSAGIVYSRPMPTEQATNKLNWQWLQIDLGTEALCTDKRMQQLKAGSFLRKKKSIIAGELEPVFS